MVAPAIPMPKGARPARERWSTAIQPVIIDGDTVHYCVECQKYRAYVMDHFPDKKQRPWYVKFIRCLCGRPFFAQILSDKIRRKPRHLCHDKSSCSSASRTQKSQRNRRR